MHQGRRPVLLSSIHPHSLLDEQSEDVILAACCCQHAQGHAADVLWTDRDVHNHSVTDAPDSDDNRYLVAKTSKTAEDKLSTNWSLVTKT